MPPSNAQDQATPSTAAGSADTRKGDATARTLRVLVVEDEPAIANGLVFNLRR